MSGPVTDVQVGQCSEKYSQCNQELVHNDILNILEGAIQNPDVKLIKNIWNELKTRVMVTEL